MNLGFEYPWVLLGLGLCLLPMWRMGMVANPYPWLAILPVDPLSLAISALIRLLGVLAIGGLILGLAGAYQQEQQVERIGHGAHIVMLLDRSNSMDNTFAGKTPETQGEESKANAARRLLNQFVDHRAHDLIGIAEYSTSPLFVLPLTENKAAIHAAIDATALPALAYTNVSKGLSMALEFFDSRPVTGSRIVLLVSDGAAVIDPDSEAALRELFKQRQVSLYWVFLRTANSPGLFEVPDDPRDDNAQAMPERYLHLFFNSLHIPYQAYEAETPGALQQAIDDINRLENRPLHYFERIPKQDLSTRCYAFAAALMLLLLGVKLCEARL
ncbi:VWA domain-containing protein [Methylomonas sp. LW13]|uniref:vWA domain-containing protein n=1 Tax=unclassified Methylomonas TaxID=2608980 RepID=UPI00051B024E|nr:vWA domain-containing protein [Methylomonas sp. LW13]QBC27566.1 VWA domain-containing protein [Methylomonas sp. LW13]